jgi:hypothetical protein
MVILEVIVPDLKKLDIHLVFFNVTRMRVYRYKIKVRNYMKCTDFDITYNPSPNQIPNYATDHKENDHLEGRGYAGKIGSKMT